MEFELFLEAQAHAKEQLEYAVSKSDRLYWQGVKDGLRKAYAIFANEPGWVALGSGSKQIRPSERTEYSQQMGKQPKGE